MQRGSNNFRSNLRLVDEKTLDNNDYPEQEFLINPSGFKN